MRPLIDFLRWKLFDFLMWCWPPEQPSDDELIAYGRIEATKPPVHYSGPLAPVARPVLGIRQRAQLRAANGMLFTPPIRRIELLSDDSWLTSQSQTDPFTLSSIQPVERDTEPTETVPAVKMRELHPRRE